MKINNNTQVMKNYHNNIKRKQSFRGGEKYIKELLSPVPGLKVAKGLTQLDKDCFGSYIYSSPFKLGITAEEIKSLTKLQGADFVVGSFNLLTKKMGIADDIKPELVPREMINDNLMCYMPNYNVVAYVSDLSAYSQAEVFHGVRHELQHFKQNMDIFRHEKLGEKAVDMHVNDLVLTEKRAIKHFVSTMSLDEMVQQGVIPNAETYDRVAKCKLALENNDMATFDNQFQSLETILKKDVVAFRQKVLDSMGVIKDGTDEAKRVEFYYNDFRNLKFEDEAGGSNYAEYLSSAIEQEALMAGTRASFEFSGGGCMIKYLKDKFKASIVSNDPEVQKVYENLEQAQRKTTFCNVVGNQ